LEVTVVGVATVFIALVMLVGAVSALARILRGPAGLATSPAAGLAADTAAPVSATPASRPGPRLRAVAIAAYAFHHHVTRRRRFAGLVEAQAGAPWRQAGRAEQATRLPTRG
jgi:Na+-transporting methylmalonyl-CoA/oxaloacetate decarboxylase gamma subunit